MKGFFLGLILAVAVSSTSFGQKHELGVFLGHPNIIGDIGKTNYIQPFPNSFQGNRIGHTLGILYRFNLNPQQSLRLNLNYNKVTFADDEAREDYRTRRDFHGTNRIFEASVSFEYYFFEVNDVVKNASSPYIFAGVGVFAADFREGGDIIHSAVRDNAGAVTGVSTSIDWIENLKFQYTIPFGIGYKIKFDYNWLIAFEVGVRLTNTETLDKNFVPTDGFNSDLNLGDEADLAQQPWADIITNRNTDITNANQTGNLSTVDWYVNTGVGITYTFGRPPCFCN